MAKVRVRVGKSAVGAGQPDGGNVGQMSAAASLDYLYCLLGTAALYWWFGILHRQGSPSPSLAAILLFSPLVGAVVLGLRGHVLPILVHVHCGATNAIAAILPLVVIGPGDQSPTVGASLFGATCATRRVMGVVSAEEHPTGIGQRGLPRAEGAD